MVKFLSVAGILAIVVISITMLWPRFSPFPRPLPLAKLHEIILKTQPGQQAANVLGVSDDATVSIISPQVILSQVSSAVRTRISNVVITHAVRAITKRFKDLPPQTQEKVLEELAKGLAESQQGELPSQDLPQATQESSSGDN